MKRTAIRAFAAFAASLPIAGWDVITPRASAQVVTAPRTVVENRAEARWQDDLAALQTFRPGYEFWRHIFTIPDGWIAFGSAVDGRLLAIFPVKGDWTREAVWPDPALADTLADQEFPKDLDERRDQVAALLLERTAGRV